MSNASALTPSTDVYLGAPSLRVNLLNFSNLTSFSVNESTFNAAEYPRLASTFNAAEYPRLASTFNAAEYPLKIEALTFCTLIKRFYPLNNIFEIHAVDLFFCKIVFARFRNFH